jgi:hypothetical protein
MIYGTFLQSLSFWYLNFGRHKISFFVFCCFSDLQELRNLGDFYSVNILSRKAAGALEPHERRHEAQTGMCGTAHLPDCTTWACLAIERRLGSVFLCTPPLWKKTSAIFLLKFSEVATKAEPFFHLRKG